MVLSNLRALKAGAPPSAFISRLRSGMFETACAIPVDRPRGASFRACAAILGLAIFSTGCLFQKKPVRALRQPPAPPSRVVDLNLPPVLDAPEVALETADAPTELAAAGSGVSEFPPPPRPAAVRRPPPAKPAAPPPAAVETP